jgi:hypothetical protein
VKDTPFIYPKDRHVRREKPPQFKSRKSYKPYLRREFERKCVYCRMPDTIKGKESFAVEHYLPRSKYPHLEYDYRNLFYACLPCNSRKGDFCPDLEHPEREVYIPNPCEHFMFEHLRFRAEVVDAHSKAGEFSVDLLGLDDDEVKAFRAHMIGMIALVKSKIQELQVTLDEIARLGDQESTPPAERLAIQQEIEEQQQLQESILDRLLGRVRP